MPLEKRDIKDGFMTTKGKRGQKGNRSGEAEKMVWRLLFLLC
jgi:hypothetical protein